MESNNGYPLHNQPPPPGGDSYASRSAQAYGHSSTSNVNQQHHQVPGQVPVQSPPPHPSIPSFQQPPYYTPSASVNQHNPAAVQSYSPQYGHNANAYQTAAASQSSMLQKTQASQQNLLEASIRRMQESSHIMRGAMDADDLPTTLDRAAAMLGELGDPKHHHHHHHGHNRGTGNGTGTGRHAHPSSTAIISPKQYYEIHMLAMEELPNIEEYFLSLSSGPSARYSMNDLYEITQYTQRAVPRLYLQICAGSALIRSGEQDVTYVLNDLIQAVKCVQCPIRGLFLRDYLLKAVRDKLPDELEQNNDTQVQYEENKETAASSVGFDEVNIEQEQQQPQQHLDNSHNETLTHLMGDLTMNMNNSDSFLTDNANINMPSNNQEVMTTLPNDSTDLNSNDNIYFTSNGRVKDSYQFVLANFIEMNKLWVRIQHLPGDAKNKDTKRRRERERNELRMMVGTNLVRLSELEGVTSAIYGTVILPRILDQIVACRDPLAQAYLMDCIIQVFPDEFHIQTLEVILNVCPKLRDKVNIRTILQSIMDRLSNYYADELLLNDEEDTEGVKTSVMLDSFEMFDECIRSVLEARGAKINAKEVIRLESSLLDFSLKCYPGRMDHINNCLGVCASCLRGENVSGGAAAQSGVITPIPMDEVAVTELETLLSLPLETMGLNVLDLDQYSELLSFLPIDHRKRVGMELLSVLYLSGEKMTEIREIEQIFAIIAPLIRGKTNDNTSPKALEERESISKLIHLLYNEDTDVHFEILNFVKKYLFSTGDGLQISSYTVSPLFFSAMKLLERVQYLEFPESKKEAPAKELVDENDCNVHENEQYHDQKEQEEKEAVNNDALDYKNSNGDVIELETVKEGNDEAQEDETDNVVSSMNDVNDGLREDNGETQEDEILNAVPTMNDINNELGEDEGETKIKDTDQVEVIDAVVDTIECIPIVSTKQNEETEQDSIDLEGDSGRNSEPKSLSQEEDSGGNSEPKIVSQEGDSGSNSEPKSLSQNIVEETLIDEKIEYTSISETKVASNRKDGAKSTSDDPDSSKATQQTKVEDSLFSSDDVAPNPLVFSKFTNCRKIFLFVQKLLSFVEMTNPDLCFSLRLQAAAAANRCAMISVNHKLHSDFSPIAYEFISEAFLTYEAEITDSSAQKHAMIKIIGILLFCECFETADYEALITKTTQYAARLIKKTDQCSLVLICSHLFFKDESVYQNPQRVLECLQRALKLADMCTTASPVNFQLFVNIFDKYVYYFEKGNPYITDKFITGLIALINEHMHTIGAHNAIIKDAKKQFTQTLEYILRKKADPLVGDKFNTVQVS